jgi:GNAT superfamily N-acetyltransferase
MIKIEETSQIHPQYFEMLENIYGTSVATSTFIAGTKQGLNTVLDNKHIDTTFYHIIENDILIGHMALICLSKDIAFFGFFELIDTQHFQQLWEKLLNNAKHKGIKTLFGPVNGTIWHPYRVITESDSEAFFVSEPLSQSNYAELFQTVKPDKTICYHSGYRTNFDLILAVTKKAMAVLDQEKIQIIQEEYSSELLHTIYQLSQAIFSKSPGYYPLSFADFTNLYAKSESSKKTLKIFLVLQNSTPIGFSFNTLHDNILIMKTIGLLPEWQEKGIGNALVHEVHQFAQSHHIQKVIYALIRSDNKVKNFPKDDAVIFRKYASYTYNLG